MGFRGISNESETQEVSQHFEINKIIRYKKFHEKIFCKFLGNDTMKISDL